uniref:Uncharacterized protein n=1 Tax=Nelumbo nucifera TaxID=4432 RepID=A0A822Z309_NELNU|nr:TPA_asm: hypothetical protein HUJ06_006528 [Nelumbo nucifera]
MDPSDGRNNSIPANSYILDWSTAYVDYLYANMEMLIGICLP